MSEFFIRATSFLESSIIEEAVEADSPADATLLFLTRRESPGDIAAIETYLSRDAYERGEESLAGWTTCDEDVLPEDCGLHEVSVWRGGACEIDGEPMIIHDPLRY